MNSHPGRARPYSGHGEMSFWRSSSEYQAEPEIEYHQAGRPLWQLGGGERRRGYSGASVEDLTSIYMRGKERRSSGKLSLKFVRKLSKLLSLSRDDSFPTSCVAEFPQENRILYQTFPLAEVHQTNRPRGAQQSTTLSRRRILASLQERDREEDRPEDRAEHLAVQGRRHPADHLAKQGKHRPEPPTTACRQGSKNRCHSGWQIGGTSSSDEDEEERTCLPSSFSSPSSASTSSFSSPSTSPSSASFSSSCGDASMESGSREDIRERFSRCYLVQSLSREEMGEEEGEASKISSVEPMNINGSEYLGHNFDLDNNNETRDCHPAFDNCAATKPRKTSTNTTLPAICNSSGTTAKNKPDLFYHHSCDNQTVGCEDRLRKPDDDDDDEEEDEISSTASSSPSSSSPSSPCPNDNDEVEPSTVRLTDLTWVSTLGVGGFGRVELVTAGRTNNHRTFALKKMKKEEINDEKQQQHILREKVIMGCCDNPFIVQLYQTYRDSRYLYMLMEPCLGGELWTILRNRKRFDDSTARFYTGCVIKAFEYLHAKGIVYRDLKPENLLLDASGYVKLTDFGFSKQLGEGEVSWTFCGTPEYVAPEIITNKSHDFRADIWSLGILMYELLTGTPPFSKNANSSSQVYVDILKGMKSVPFPTYLSSTAVELIRQLCRLQPTQRPSLHITARYMWFSGFDWEGLADRTLAPPFLPTIGSSCDTSNFDNYGREESEPAEDFSDWDRHF